MIKTIFSSILIASLCGAARAAVPADFALNLNRGEAGVLAFQARLVKAQDAALPQDIRNADQNVGILIQQAAQLRQDLAQIKSQIIGAPPIPNPSIRAELDQTVSNFNIFVNNIQYVESQVQTLSSRAKTQPDAVAPAQNLQSDASTFGSYAQWLYNEALMDAPSFSGAGYAEGEQIQIYAPQTMSRAQELKELCTQLLNAVR
ncbi:MAG TPA: hypothetical protein VNK24_10065 [Elusimicrobiota bacterium]|nr:hypothetical protein [Elusimicrobiota bacterium]